MTGKMINVEGIPLLVPNDITAETKDFYISYNDRDSHIYGSDTTALVLNNPTRFLILNGNHSNQYNEIIANGGSYADCVEYFKAHPEQKAKYSENWDEMMIFKDGKLVTVKIADIEA